MVLANKALDFVRHFRMQLLCVVGDRDSLVSSECPCKTLMKSGCVFQMFES